MAKTSTVNRDLAFYFYIEQNSMYVFSVHICLCTFAKLVILVSKRYNCAVCTKSAALSEERDQMNGKYCKHTSHSGVSSTGCMTGVFE